MSAQTVLMPSQVRYFVAASGRHFAAFLVAVLVFIVNPMSRELLLFESPAKRGRQGWEVVSGAVEHGETLIDAVHREVREEAGADVRIDVLGALHTWNWHYDHRVPNMISAAFMAAYLGGDVTPGDDLTGSDFRRASVAQPITRSVGSLMGPGAKAGEAGWILEANFSTLEDAMTALHAEDFQDPKARTEALGSTIFLFEVQEL